jgi:hypothetical protein
MPGEDPLPEKDIAMPVQARAFPFRPELPLGNDPASVRRRIEVVERLLERSFTVPGTRLPVGLDSIIGLVPVAGDLIGAVIGLYCVWEARNLGMSKWQLARMGGNIGFDTLVGMIPFAGDAFDFVFRSNTRNLRIIRKHLDRHHPQSRIIEG